jgi:hypothetical protein
MGGTFIILGIMFLIGFAVVSLWTHTFVTSTFLGILLAISVGGNLVAGDSV